MKKYIYMVILTTFIIILHSANVYADTCITQEQFTTVYYDETDQYYYMCTKDNDTQTGFVIELFSNESECKFITTLLNNCYKNKNIIIEYDNMNTTNIYDDVIINWWVK